MLLSLHKFIHIIDIKTPLFMKEGQTKEKKRQSTVRKRRFGIPLLIVLVR
jgi:hypothetical protein